MPPSRFGTTRGPSARGAVSEGASRFFIRFCSPAALDGQPREGGRSAPRRARASARHAEAMRCAGMSQVAISLDSPGTRGITEGQRGMRAGSRPASPIEASVLNRLGQGRDLLFLGEVRDRARHAQDARVGARREPEPGVSL